MSKYWIPRDHVIRHVVIRDDTDESLAEDCRRNTTSCIFLATYCIICGRKSSNGDQAQSGRYTERQDALNKRKAVGTLEISYSKIQFSTF